MTIAGSTIESPSGTPKADDPAGEQTGGNRILVVDDNIDTALSAAEILRLMGNEVSVAHDGLAAVRIVTEWHPEVVLLDISLPGISGYEVARRIRKQAGGKDIMLVALTGWDEDRDRLRATEAGFNRHWVKPIGLEKLKEISMGRRDG